MRLHAKPDAVFDLSIRSLHPETDLPIIFEWVNASYSKRFWQMGGGLEGLTNTYKNILKNPTAHSFIISLRNKPVAQVDLYMVAGDELIEHVPATDDDAGLHLLMCPPEQMKKGLSVAVLRFFIRYYFSFPQSAKLYAEPDVNNGAANLLARKAGFAFVKKISLSYKEANLFVITRENAASL